MPALLAADRVAARQLHLGIALAADVAHLHAWLGGGAAEAAVGGLVAAGLGGRGLGDGVGFSGHVCGGDDEVGRFWGLEVGWWWVLRVESRGIAGKKYAVGEGCEDS